MTDRAEILMYVEGPLSKKHAHNWLTLAYYGALDQENNGACGFSNTIMEAGVLIEWIKEREKGKIPRWSKENEDTAPHSIEAERIALGAIISDAAGWGRVSEYVVPGDFYFERHQIIYRCLKGMAENNIPHEVRTLVVELAEHLEECGGKEYINQLAKMCHGDFRNASTYAKIIRERAILRNFKNTGVKLSNMSVQAGKITALCPFHEEKTPSFYIDLKDGIYRCLSCGVRGNASDL